MKRLYLIFISLFIFSAITYSQEDLHTSDLQQLYDSLYQYERRGSLTDGINFGYSVLEQSKSEGNKKIQGRTMHTIAKLLYYQNQLDSGTTLAKKTLALSLEEQEHNMVINSSNFIAQVNFETSLYDSSLVYYRFSMETAKEHVPNRYPGTLTNMAFINSFLGRDEVEMTYYFKALEVLEEHPEYDESGGARAMCYGGVGDYYLRIGEYENAKENFEAKLLLGQQKESTQMIYEAHAGLGNLFAMPDYYDFKESEANYQIIIQDTTKSYEHYRGNAFIGIGKLNTKAENYSAALNFFQEALTIYKHLNNPDWLSRVQYQIGEIHLKTNKLSAAETWLTMALDNALKGKLTLRERDALYGLYRLDSVKNDYKSSFMRYQRYRAIEDSLFTEESRDKISELQVEYEAAEKERENLILKNDLNLSEAKLEKQRLIQFIIIGVTAIMIMLAFFFYRSFKRKKESAIQLEARNKVILEQKDELSFKSDKLELVNSQLKSIAEFKTDLTRMIAHDMKNPLNAIIGLSTTDSKDKRINNITQSGYQLLNLVTNMLEVDKYETTDYSPERTAVPLDQIILDSRRRIEILLEAKGIRFESLIPKLICVKVDAEAIRRVFVNLLSNAIKYSPTEGRVVIDKLKVVDGMIWLRVTDQGAGISEDRLANVFDKFWQSDAKESGFAVSTGLGLTFCKMTVEAHGGEIWAESEIGKGTSMYLTLPIEAENTCEKILASMMEDDSPDTQEESLVDENERELLLGHAGFLKELKVHQVSAISRVLKDLEDKGVKSKWRMVLQSSVYQADQARYDQLLDVLIEGKEERG